MPAKTEVVMQCEHSLRFTHAAPRIGERIYCRDCQDMRRVTGGPGDYRADCTNCTALKVTRKTPGAIRRCVIQHLLRCPTHRVSVWQIGADSVLTVALTEGQQLAGFDPPDTLPYGG